MLGVARNVFASLGPVGKTVVGAATAVVAATPFGAWATVSEDLTPLSAGQVVEVGPYELAIEKVVSTPTLGQDVRPQDEANKLLVVVAEVENVSDRPAAAAQLGDVVPAPVGAGIVDGDLAIGDDVPPGERPVPRIFNIEDASSVTYINPDLTYRFALVWEHRGDVDVDEVRLHLTELSWIAEGESFAGLADEYWLPLHEVSHDGVFPVEPPKSEADASDSSTDPSADAPSDAPAGSPTDVPADTSTDGPTAAPEPTA